MIPPELMMKRVLVTGAAGYIGSVLTRLLLTHGYFVDAVDDFRYGQHLALAGSVAHTRLNVHNVKMSFLDSDYEKLVKEADVIIPLAALVGEPLCANRKLESWDINYFHVVAIVNRLRKDQLIIYPNTNSAYGTMPAEGNNVPLTEDSPQNPLSIYAKTKCKAEDAVLQHPNSVVFRLATVFGASPRMRTDLLVNDFVLRAVRDKFVMLFSPNARRNFVHVHDVARAFHYVVMNNTPDGERVFNLGHDGSNCTKLELCRKIRQYVDFEWAIGRGDDPDRRDYIISNERLRQAGFEAFYTLDDGIKELVKLYSSWPKSVMGNV